jgi:hypothetical protein
MSSCPLTNAINTSKADGSRFLGGFFNIFLGMTIGNFGRKEDRFAPQCNGVKSFLKEASNFYAPVFSQKKSLIFYFLK